MGADLGQFFSRRAFVFVRTQEGKERLRPALSAGNTEKTMSAPVTAIVAYDTRFYEHLPQQFPARQDGDHLVQRPRQGRGERDDGIPQRHSSGCLPDNRRSLAGT